jgi:hypothetical protein
MYRLLKLFPDNVITVEKAFTRYNIKGEIKECYRAYINSNVLGNNSFSPEFKTINELDKFLAYKIDGYKPVYKN